MVTENALLHIYDEQSGQNYAEYYDAETTEQPTESGWRMNFH